MEFLETLGEAIDSFSSDQSAHLGQGTFAQTSQGFVDFEAHPGISRGSKDS